MEDMSMGPKVCKCSHHKMGGIFAILFALLFLAGYQGYVTWNLVNWGWPIIVIVVALTKMMGGKCKCC